MKVSSYFFVLFVSCLLIIGCGADKKQKPDTKEKTSTKKGAAKGNKVVSLDKIAKDLKLTPAQLNGIKAINKKYNERIAALTKAKKWNGKENEKNRLNNNKAKQSELKKLLDKKYSDFNKAINSNKKETSKSTKKKPTSPKGSKKKK